MDNEIVYRKTPAGDQAMRQRKRLMQRNLRMVLILVDGVSPVSELAKKTGDAQLTASALGELLQGGFIEPVPAREVLTKIDSQVLIGGEKEKTVTRVGDTAPEQPVPVAASSGAASPPEAIEARPRTSFLSGLLGKKKGEDHGGATGSKTSSTLARQREKQPAGEAQGEMKDSELSLFSTFSQEPKAVQAPGKKMPAPAQIKRDRLQGKIDRSEASFETISMPKVSARSQEAHKAAVDNSDFKQRLEHSKNRLKGRWWLVPLLLCLVLSVGFALFSVERYVPQIEQKLLAATGSEVRVEAVDVTFKPQPGLVLRGVHIGKGQSVLRAENVRLGAFSVLPLLFSDTARIDVLEVAGIDFGHENLTALPALLASLSRPEGHVSVRRINFERMSLSLSGLRLENLEGEAVPATPVQEALKLRSTDRSLSLTLKPDGGHVALSLEAYGWRPVPDSGVQIDSLSLTGVAKPQDFNVSAFDVRVFNGAFRGRGVISGGEAYRVSGDLSFEHLNAGRMSEVLAGGALVQGEAAGEMSFSARAPNWQGLFAQFEAEGRFSFGRGGLRGIDFVEAVRRSGDIVQGGATAFEQLSGRFRVRQGNVRFSDLSMSSGLMQSRGNLDIAAEARLQGRFELQLKGSANQTRIPIAVTGNVKSPVVQMNR